MKPIFRANLKAKKVALTFDDGPSPKNTPLIIDLLTEYDARATFFCVGKQVLDHPKIVAKLIEAGNEVGNHGFSHTRFSRLTKEKIREEISRTDLLIRALGAATFPPVRAPFAEQNAKIDAVLSESGRRNILFDCESTPPDFKQPSSLEISCSLARIAKPGSIILLHDGGKPRHGSRRETVEATEQLLDYFRRNQFELVTVSELLNRKSVETKFPKRTGSTVDIHF